VVYDYNKQCLLENLKISTDAFSHAMRTFVQQMVDKIGRPLVI